MRSHNEEIIDQFSRQAALFAEKMRAEHESVERIFRLGEASKDDNALDVACGPGLLACAVAPHVHRVTGVDITRKMIYRAQAHQEQLNITNIGWSIGDVDSLPFMDRSFSLVMTRFSFHHLIDPGVGLREMKRVCSTGGRIVIADVALNPENAEKFNRMEKLRDPSHVRALTVDELEEVVSGAGLKITGKSSYRLELELQKQLQASFPRPGDADEIRDMFRDEPRTNSMGVEAHVVNGRIRYSYPVTVIAGKK